MPAQLKPIVGECNGYGDVTINVESHRIGTTLLTIDFDDDALPIELSNVTALELANRIIRTVEEKFGR